MERQEQWKKLLAHDRVRKSSSNGNNNRSKEDELYDHRNEFDKDYDRIVYSSSLRRLQDKAQVFPLQMNDFTRTRLTHSLEAAALGRSLGYAIGEWLLDKKDFKDYKQVRELSALLQVSALIHDLGNPPFGHYGEAIIRNWFINWFESKDENIEDEYMNKNKRYFYERQKELLKIENKNISDEEIELKIEQQISDLKSFEGNAQTLRIVSKLQLLNDENGVNFTYGTLSTIMKYPWESNSKKGLDKKKFAYFYSENELANTILNSVGLKKGVRHPVTYLLEAADDMAYLLADVEDAVKKGIIPWALEYENLKENIKKRIAFYKDEKYKGKEIKDIDVYNEIDLNKIENTNEVLYKEVLDSYNNIYDTMFKSIDKQMEKNQLNRIPEQNLANVQNFKVHAQGLMFKKVVNMFKENYNAIMEGEYGIRNLLEESELKELVEEMKRIAAQYCYTNKEVLTLELVGDEVITGLLDKFVNALVYHEGEIKTKNREGKLHSIISDNFKYIACLDENTNKNRGENKIEMIRFEDVDVYKRMLLITDFISGMTDSYAVNLYKELIGVKLP